jgi:hypothetical protein
MKGLGGKGQDSVNFFTYGGDYCSEVTHNYKGGDMKISLDLQEFMFYDDLK